MKTSKGRPANLYVRIIPGAEKSGGLMWEWIGCKAKMICDRRLTSFSVSIALNALAQLNTATLHRLRFRRRMVIIGAFLFTLTMIHNVGGQATEFGALNGTVSDQQGIPIINARVTATNTATNAVQTVLTNEQGLYRIFNLLPGQYEMTLEAQGFKIITIAPFKLDIGQTLTQNVTLVVGSVTQQAQVSAKAQLLETTTVADTTTIESQQINDLPLNGRNYTSLIDLTPGTDGSRTIDFCINDAIIGIQERNTYAQSQGKRRAAGRPAPASVGAAGCGLFSQRGGAAHWL